MPVYKVEMYLEKAVGSILKQTLREIELILVDDGSPDNCGKMADMYAEADDRIRVIHQENTGLGPARNAGLKAGRGEYVGFVDSDDWIEPRMYEVMYHAARVNGCDIVMCGCVRENAGGRSETVILPMEEGVYGKEDILNKVLFPMVARNFDEDPWKSVINSVWKNIYRRELLVQNRIGFQSERLAYAEDLLFNLEAFVHAERLFILNQPFYHYRHNISSLSNVYRTGFNRMNQRLYGEMEHFVIRYGLEDECRVLLQKRMVEMAFAMVINVLKPGNPAPLCRKIGQIHEILKLPQVNQAMREFRTKGLPLAKRILYFCFKKEFPGLLYLIFRYWIMRRGEGYGKS
jgi:glycosyltransferase involved in cell wall biosynthesis